MTFRHYLFVAVVMLVLAFDGPAFSATENTTPSSPPHFAIHAELAKAYQVVAPDLAKGKPVTVLVTFQNTSDQEQTLAPCGRYGVWATDSRFFYVEPDNTCKVEGTITIAPHNSFPGVLTLNLRAIGWNSPGLNMNVQPPRTMRIGLLPASVSMCDAIVHGSHGQCGDADTAWSNPIPLGP